MKTKELRKFFEPLDTEKLPSVDKAKQLIHDTKKVEQERNSQKDKAKDAFEHSIQRPDAAQPSKSTKQSIASKAQKAFAAITDSKKLPDYGQALASRLAASKSLAQSVKAKLGSIYDRVASQIEQGMKRASSLVGKDKADAKGLRINQPKEPIQDHKATFNKASKALEMLSKDRGKAEGKEQRSEGPAHDR